MMWTAVLGEWLCVRVCVCLYERVREAVGVFLALRKPGGSLFHFTHSPLITSHSHTPSQVQSKVFFSRYGVLSGISCRGERRSLHWQNAAVRLARAQLCVGADSVMQASVST